MDDACDELDDIIDDELKDNLMKYFRHMASMFVVSTEKSQEFSNMKLHEELPVNNFPTPVEKKKVTVGWKS